MSHAAVAGHGDHHGHDAHHGPDPRVLLSRENIYLPEGAGKGVSTILLGVGAVCIALTVAGAVVHGPKHALASYLVGVMAVMAMSLGAMFFVMSQHLINAGWSVTIRRQAENIMSLLPFAVALLIPYLIAQLVLPDDMKLIQWMRSDIKGDYLLQKKAAYLNEPFFVIRSLLYIGIWLFLCQRLWSHSVAQDRTGDRTETVKARRMCTWGMFAFALSVAFASFDWLMSLDFRFFSTMWPVYIFAGCAFSSVALMAIVIAVLRTMGRLTGVVTQEHSHDLGKLMFSFSVFWAYIAFSQYFLIWYSNIPEETAYYLHRREGGWEVLSALLCFGHFVVPFLILMLRKVKQSSLALAGVGLWMLLMHVLDVFWIVRPMVYANAPADTSASGVAVWLDIVAIFGIVAIYAGLLVRKVASGVLIPLNDPRQDEALAHKNYV
ncbi:MAG: hypothetical protein KF705_03525 [Phycisphaeraceae bacterium]|nr:hypothetical protein [Phycisphaeraceae bacterium]